MQRQKDLLRPSVCRLEHHGNAGQGQSNPHRGDVSIYTGNEWALMSELAVPIMGQTRSFAETYAAGWMVFNHQEANFAKRLGGVFVSNARFWCVAHG